MRLTDVTDAVVDAAAISIANKTMAGGAGAGLLGWLMEVNWLGVGGLVGGYQPAVEDAPGTSDMPARRVSAAGLKVIKHFEGLRLEAYKDPVGVLTIGYGDTGNVHPGQVITEVEAEARLKDRLAREFTPGVLSALTRDATQGELDAMVSLAYNVGVGAFRASTLVRKFNAGENAAGEFERWVYAGGKQLLGLKRRRAAERALFEGKSAAVAIRIAEAMK